MRTFPAGRSLILLSLVMAALSAGAGSLALGVCGPFTDAAADAFCPFVLEIFTLGITTGTTPTTYEPAANVSRLQMAAFLSRSVDTTLKRGSRRLAFGQLWTPQNESVLGVTTVGADPTRLQFDGADIWAGVFGDAAVSRIRASDGRLLESWTGANQGWGILVAMSRVFVAGGTNPGRLYRIDPGQSAGAVTTVASNLGPFPQEIAFDGARVWTANFVIDGSVSIITPGAAIPWTVTTVSVGAGSRPFGALFDGANIWITDFGLGKLLRLDNAGVALQTVTVGAGPAQPAFDGTNIWVPNLVGNSVSVVRAANGTVLRTLTGNGLGNPLVVGFDGERILVTNENSNSVSLWKAADLSPLGAFPIGHPTAGVCSDGTRFWLALSGDPWVARF